MPAETQALLLHSHMSVNSCNVTVSTSVARCVVLQYVSLTQPHTPSGFLSALYKWPWILLYNLCLHGGILAQSSI